ncbi:MAG: PorT family protein [Chitinophagaceae bacterium]|nr:PorT family protein [Chitinophagaceae bacterium]
MKRSLVLFGMLFLSAASFAQEGLSSRISDDGGRKIRIGFKLDPGISWLGPKEKFVSKDGSQVSISYGFMADFIIDPNYAIASGLQITHGGGKLRYQNDKGLFENGQSADENLYKVSLQYLEIPLALKLKTNPIGNLTYWGQFGTYLGVNIGARLDATVDGQPEITKEKITGHIVPINGGLLLGAGIEYPLNDKTTLSLGLGFQNGFVDVTRNKSWNDAKVILNNFSLRAGVYF